VKIKYNTLSQTLHLQTMQIDEIKVGSEAEM